MEIKVRIDGVAPLLMNNPALAMRSPDRATGRAPKVPMPDEEARRARYLTPDGKHLALKADHLKRCLMVATSGYRMGGTRKSAVPYVAGSISVTPDSIPLLNPKSGKALGAEAFEVDTRRCVVRSGMQKLGVMRSRALVWPWAAAFVLWFDEDVLPPEWMERTFRQEIFKQAGKAVGLLDYRPPQGGAFGRFVVVEWAS